jgi:23S rRNA (adenine2503-C2)-methyltransferase
LPQRLLYNLTFDELAAWMSKHGEKPFHARQVFEWAYRHNAASFEQMTNLSKQLRLDLADTFRVGPLQPTALSAGAEATKLLLDLPHEKGGSVECVRIRMGNTYTACVSTQVGCNVRCAFCATGQQQCERNLSVGEILLQVISLRAKGLAGEEPATADEPFYPVSNVVFMGMGEPFHNYPGTVAAVRMLTDKRAFGMSPSRITVSTSGVVPMIRRYTQEGLPTELTISLNASNDEVRQRLMPGASKWPISEVVAACKEYSEATGGQPVTFAYVIIEGVNDLLDHTRELAKLLRRQPHHVNVIPLNPVSHANLRAPNRERINAFIHHCRQFGLNVSLRHSKGVEIDAACGQLRARRQG